MNKMDKTLFENDEHAPLAERMRARNISEVIGQRHLLGENGKITQMIRSKHPKSFILWGPPGCGKTTIAKVIAGEFSSRFVQISAVFSGVAELKKIFAEADAAKKMGETTILFVDEIHRFNKAQQDAFLPYVESGTVVLIGATTENPSFEINSALLSRCQVFILNALDDGDLEELIERAEKFQKKKLNLTEEAKTLLKNMAAGDGRYLLNMIEMVFEQESKNPLSVEALTELVAQRFANYDKAGEGHYNLISALHKSLRGSDVDAALYWLARMLAGGEDPTYVLRRLTRFAYEDVGLADPQALAFAIDVWQAYERIGSPEGELAIANLVIYLALAPKSNSGYAAFAKVNKSARNSPNLPPPKHIINAPTKLMAEQGFGEGYVYDHDTEHGFSGQNYFPDKMRREVYYKPVERGFEREMKKRLDYYNELRKKLSN